MTGPFCAAFLGGIPAFIYDNEFDHRQPADNDHGLQWIPRFEGAKFPTYAFDPAVLGGRSEETGAATLVAAADAAATGAMIALIPTPEHAARLALPGGEAVDDLHCTLIFLGEAAELDASDRDALDKWARTMVQGWTSVEAEAFAPAVFNPTGDDPCMVLVLSGADLAEFYETTLADVSDLVVFPEQHVPYIPHITLRYLEPSGEGLADAADFGGMVERCGPIVFDRLRLAFAGEITDIPISAPTPAEVDEEPAPEIEEPAEAEPVAALVTASGREIFSGCPRCYGEEHDGPCNPLLYHG